MNELLSNVQEIKELGSSSETLNIPESVRAENQLYQTQALMRKIYAAEH